MPAQASSACEPRFIAVVTRAGESAKAAQDVENHGSQWLRHGPRFVHLGPSDASEGIATGAPAPGPVPPKDARGNARVLLNAVPMNVLTAEVAALLPPGACAALEQVLLRPLSFSARFLVTPLPERRLLVILGEAHIKLGAASALGKALVSCFSLRGVETFQRRQVTGGRLLGFLIHVPRVLLRTLSLGVVKDSTIVDAKAITTGATVELERASSVPLSLHAASVYLAALFSVLYTTLLLQVGGVALHPSGFFALGFEIHCYALLPAYVFRHRPWAWLIHPAIALLTVRDSLMAAGTVRMLREHSHATAAIVVMGRAHVQGYERELLERFAFMRLEPANG
jgi:hypothetical protein